jgi:hypothetical protein
MRYSRDAMAVEVRALHTSGSAFLLVRLAIRRNILHTVDTFRNGLELAL